MYKNIYCKMTDRNKIIVKNEKSTKRRKMKYVVYMIGYSISVKLNELKLIYEEYISKYNDKIIKNEKIMQNVLYYVCYTTKHKNTT